MRVCIPRLEIVTEDFRTAVAIMIHMRMRHHTVECFPLSLVEKDAHVCVQQGGGGSGESEFSDISKIN